jgi:NAD(P)-dependent dehydrogenase (short-subunit alcohol dehydrogenase family)
MSEKTVLITGASRGLGAAAAFIAAELGANVVLNARSADRLAEHVDHIQNAGGKAISIPGDISQAEACQELIQKSLDHFGRIDSLINNAGAVRPIMPLRRTDLAQWQQNLAVNLMGPVMLTRAALPQLRLHKGRVINVSSGAALNPIPGMSAYCTAKAGLNHFTRVLAAEEDAVTAIAFRPGVVDTQMQETVRMEGASGMPPENHDQFMRYYQHGDLLPPQAPGGALAILALFAPSDWSGQFLSWDAPKIQELRLHYSAGH